MPLHLLHVAQPVDGGVGRYVAAAVLAQREAGHRVTVACPPDGELPVALREAGVTLHTWRANREPGPRVPGEARALGRLVVEVRPDLVHLHSSKAGLAGRLALRGRVPTVFQPHGWSWLAAHGVVRRGGLAWERSGARWSDATVCVGQDEADQGRLAGVAGGLVVVRNGVDLQAFALVDRAAARVRLGLEADVPIVVGLGRASRQKGFDRLVGAWPGVVAEYPRALLLLAGDGPELSALQASAGPRATLLGAVADPAGVLAAADLVVLPSRWEGLSLALLEALSCGRAVLTTRVSGSEVVAGLPASVLPVAPDDDAAVQECLGRMIGQALADPAGLQARGRQARELAERELDVRTTWSGLDDVYRDVLARRTLDARRRDDPAPGQG